MTHRVLLALAAVLFAPSAWASSPHTPDLAVTLTPPVSVQVDQPAGYNVRVKNVGHRSAAGVKLTIQLPRTQTSPSVYIMGTLGGYSAPCVRTGTTLVCSLGTLGRNDSTSVFFEIALPYSTAPLVFSAVATTTTLPEPNQGNNTQTHTANPLPYNAVVTSTGPALNRHCTGQATLSSFFECTLFPSSITSHQTTFNAGGSITFFDGPATFNGTWTHTPATRRLQFSYYDGTVLQATFDGRGVSAKCFEGKTTFPSSPTYVSMYQVCFP